MTKIHTINEKQLQDALINIHFKAIFLILFYSLGGIAGVYSLGIMAGTLYIFPAAAVIIAIFYSARALWVYILLYLLFFCFVAFLFCSGKTVLPYSADNFLTSYFHWTVYFLCIVIFFTVAGTTIFIYRRSMELMIDEITLQK